MEPSASLEGKFSVGRCAIFWLLALLLSGALLPVNAAPKSAPVEAKRGELNQLHERIGALQRELSKNEESKDYAADQLKETESAISDSNRVLRELGQQRNETQAALNDLQSQSQRLEGQITAQQAQLAHLLYRQYLDGEADALRLILSGSDPNQSARDLHYLALLARAKATLISALNTALAEKQKLANAARAKRDELVAIEQKQSLQRARLLTQQKQRQTTLARIAGRIKAQRREIDTLKRDEKRLAKLIEGLARIVAKTKKPPHKTATFSRPGATTPSAEPLENERTPESMGPGGNFALLKGRLRLPVRGQLTNRFGMPRTEGGATWKGLLIRAAEGVEVKAVAAGQVVFADWLRGFGNLLILDHGDSFLTVYGNNQSLFRRPGDTVKGGDAIASVGNSGGNPESGLYFEIRQQGLAVDPLKWVSLR